MTRKIKSIFTLVTPFVLIMGGCTNSPNLKSIQVFTTLSNEAADKFPKIVSDLYGSCVRSTRFKSIEDRDTEKKRCADIYNQSFEYQVNVPHEVLVNYLRALAQLAADDAVNFDPELNNLAKAIESTGAAKNKEQVRAVNGIVNFLLTSNMERYRRKELKKAIQNNDKDVQILIDGVKETVDTDYILQLGIEKESMRKRYAVDIARYQNQEPLTALLVDKQWYEEQAELEKKKAVAITYVEVMNEIAEAHSKLKKLYDSGENVNSKKVSKTVLEHAQKLALLLEDLRQAF